MCVFAHAHVCACECRVRVCVCVRIFVRGTESDPALTTHHLCSDDGDPPAQGSRDTQQLSRSLFIYSKSLFIYLCSGDK